MNDENPAKVLIRHLTGDTAGEAEAFSVAARDSISFGREFGQDVVFDGELAVAPRHAVIRIAGGDKPTFRLEDVSGGRGVYLNGVRLSEPTELLPEDEIALGEGGPRLIFDLEPRPAHVGLRQRLDAPPAVVASPGLPASAALAPTPPVAQSEIAGPVGAPPQPTKPDWTSAFAVMAGLALVGLGGLLWKNSGGETPPPPAAVEAAAPAPTVSPPRPDETATAAFTPEEIVERHAAATALVLTHWRLYDKETGKPVFVKVLRQDNVARPLFVELPNRSVIPWLTFDDDRQANAPVSGVESGTGFAVSPEGLLLTSKSVAAGWTNPYGACHCREEKGWLARFGDLVVNGRLLRRVGRRIRREQASPIDLGAAAAGEAFLDWVPGRGGYVLENVEARFVPEKGADLAAAAKERAFVGENESIDVVFPHSESSVKAALAKLSEAADAALLRISDPHAPPSLSLATTPVAAGEKLVVLGYPTDDAPSFSRSGLGSRDEAAALAEAQPRASIVEASGVSAEAITLAQGSRNPGDRGGPVFNTKGEVVGIYARGSATGAEATPIRFGRDLESGLVTGK